MTGYVRQSSADIVPTAVVRAAPINNEYNALRDAFDQAGGHKHDGTAAEGHYVPLIADSDARNKVAVDTVNNRHGVFVEVGGTSVEQVRVQDGAIVPVTNNDIDLGTNSLQFKDLYIDGTGNIDSLIADTADINAGTIDNTVIGATTPAAATVTTLTSTGSTTLNGTTVPASKTLVVTTDKLSVHAATSSSELASVISDETGTGALVFANSPTLVTPALGTPSSATLTNATGLPLTSGVTGTLPVANGGTGITSFGTGVAAFLGTPSSANLATAVTDETGSGALVFANSPTLVTPALGTPSSATLTNATGLPISTGVSGLGTNVASALAVNIGSAGAPVVNGGALGTPSSGVATNLTGLPLTSGVTGTLPVANGGTGITSLGTGVATFLGTPSSSNLAAAVTDETGTGALVFANSPTLVTPTLGTPASATLTNATGLPLSTGVTGTLPIANGGTSATTALGARTALLPSFTGNAGKVAAVNSGATDIEYITVAGTGTVTSVGGTGTVNGITLSGTVTASGNLTLGGTLSGVDLTTQVTGTLPIANGGTGTTTRQGAMNALANAVTSGQYLRGNGTDVVMSAIQVADIPTLNQNTTGTAANVTGTIAVTNGGTGATSLTANNVILGNGTSAVQVVAPGTTGNVLTSNGTTWQSTAPAVTLAGSETLTNKTISADNNTLSGIAASSFVLSNASGNIDGSAAQKAIPAGVVVGTTDSQTLTNKTLTSPVIGTIVNTGTLTLPTSTDTLVGRATTDTLSNKRIDPRNVVAASASTLTPDVSVGDIYAYTALAAGLTINAPTGTPTDGDKLIFRLLDNGTARALTWNATYTAIGVTIPTTTVVNKTTYVGCIYNANNTRWDVIAVTTQA